MHLPAKYVRALVFLTTFFAWQHFNLEAIEDGDKCQKDGSIDSSDSKKEEDKKDQEEKKDDEPLKIGFLAFPTSQQPGPLIAFGQNFVDKGQLQAILVGSYIKGHKQYAAIINPTFVYGVTDTFSLFFAAPDAVKLRQGEDHSSGIQDLLLQVEYGFYTKNKKDSSDEASVVANVTFPTGSTKKSPPTGDGQCSCFLGFTYNRMTFDWYYFASTGGIWNGSNQGTRFGSQFLYQGGIGRMIVSSDDWYLSWLIEGSGTLADRNRIDGKTDHNSGGNVIYVTPSLTFATIKRFFIQGGIQVPLYQHLFGKQTRNDVGAAVNIGWVF